MIRKRGLAILWVLVLALTSAPMSGIGNADLLGEEIILEEGSDLVEGAVNTVTGTVGAVEDTVDSTLNGPSSPGDDGGGETTNESGGNSDQQESSGTTGGQSSENANAGSSSTSSPNTGGQPTQQGDQVMPQTQEAGGTFNSGRPRAFMHEFNQPLVFAAPTGPRSTRQVLDILKSANATPQQRARVLAPFPVLGEASYSNDWGAPRYVPVLHSHEGTDIFAEKGTPVIASGDGEISTLVTGSKIAGNMIKLTAADGTYFIYSHLDGFALGISKGMKVRLGQVIGFVGNSGNAEGTVPHLHFEIHPNGGAAVPPIPYLDRWLAEALQKARALQQVPSTSGGFGAALSGLTERIAQGAAQLSGSVLETKVQGVTATNVASWGLLLTIPVVWYLRRRYRGAELPLAD